MKQNIVLCQQNEIYLTYLNQKKIVYLIELISLRIIFLL